MIQLIRAIVLSYQSHKRIAEVEKQPRLFLRQKKMGC